MRALTGLLLVVFGVIWIAAGPESARAEPAATIRDFAGPWVGRTDAASDRERGATLLVELYAGDVFRLVWTNFEADGASPGGVARRDRSIVFRPAAQPGIWLADTTGDPFELMGGWARIAGDALVVDLVALRPDGRLERQHYARTLADNGMDLDYRRWLDDALDREITARFVRL